MSDKLWFKAKTYGIGWYPVTWQGFLVTLIFVSLVVCASLLAESLTKTTVWYLALYFSFIIVLVIALILICTKKGEPLRWRWGE